MLHDWRVDRVGRKGILRVYNRKRAMFLKRCGIVTKLVQEDTERPNICEVVHSEHD